MNKIYAYILFIFPLLVLAQNGGVGIGTNGIVDDSAILHVGNVDKKGVLFPQVELLDDLSNTNYPIENPVNGMIIYNIGKAQFHGYYYWDNNQWKLMGDSSNVVTDSVFRITTPITSFLASNPIGTYSDVNSNTWEQFSNNISGLSGTSNGVFTLPPGSYLIHINANISIPDLSTSAGIYNDLHLVKLSAKLYDGASNTFGSTRVDNGVLRSGVHQYSTNFDIEFTIDSLKTMQLALSMADGGSYSNGVGGAAPNNGNITINNISIHFQRVIATP